MRRLSYYGRCRLSRNHRRACILVAVAAVAAFLWAVSSLFFHSPVLSEGVLRANSFVLAILWGLGPAVWFALEWKFWRAEPNLAVGQGYARDFWIGAGAIVLVLVAEQLTLPSERSVARETVGYVTDWPIMVELIRVLAWPLFAGGAAILLRKPVIQLANALGTRVTKFGVFDVSFELAAEAGRWSGPSLDTFKDPAAALVGDSSGSLFRALGESSSADYAVVDLGMGKEWLASRLYILAAAVPRVRGLKRLVFVHGTAQNYVGTAPPSAVRIAIARAFPWLEEAYIRAHLYVNNNEIKFHEHLRTNSTEGPLTPDAASQVVQSYLSAIQMYPADPTRAGWEVLGHYSEHTPWLDTSTVEQLLGRELERSAVTRDPGIELTALTKAMLRHDSHYVAVVDTGKRFQRLIDRVDAMTQIVRKDL